MFNESYNIFYANEGSVSQKWKICSNVPKTISFCRILQMEQMTNIKHENDYVDI